MVAQNKRPGTLLAAARHFDEPTARAYVQSIKWPDGPGCPKCGSVNVGEIKSRNRFQCREKECRKQFSLITGTIFEGTHLKLEQWMVGIWMVVNCRNGVSSCELARTIGCKQQSAWHLLHRARHLLEQDADRQFEGTVEVDETFVGGLMKFMSYDRWERARKRPNKGKAVVHAILERDSGQVRAEVIEAAGVAQVRDAVMEHVAPRSRVYTDSSRIYDWLAGSWYTHNSVNHAKEYVRGDCHVNGLEGFFNCLRRGLKGTYIAARPEHLSAYVDEQVWRYNNRKRSDWERFNDAMQRIVGKRLTYTELTDGAKR